MAHDYSGQLMHSMFDTHPLLARILVLCAILASGFFEAFVLDLKELACVTWFTALAALTAWVAYPLTLLSIGAATAIFALGLILLIRFYRSRLR